ncbi:hypothetical protein RI844_17895 [Thalassotalea fonticola]|uniref:Outer membrane protein beta-barrel domain-containing protein n=1 Tax=Thalassotalea fonticola TaxID=3065649 RepID=A0ABZ0GN00_9GAMM|nr:hypothetical protein RI844_17895 [Colwelliaceae bacterium S1-1]
MFKFFTVMFYILLLLISVLCRAEQPLSSVDNVAIALERQTPLNQNVDLDGLVFASKKSFFNAFFIGGEFTFLEEEVGDSQFTLTQQQVILGYRYPVSTKFEMRLSIGGIREELEHTSQNFNSKSDDASLQVKLTGIYDVNFIHSLGSALHHYELYNIERYYLTLFYQFKLTRKWQIYSHLELGYNTKVEHDINGYQLQLKYAF